MAPEYASNLFSLRILLIYFQTITLGNSNVSSTLFQRRDVEQHWIKVISTPCVCRLFIWTPIPACLWTPGTQYKRDSLAMNPFKNPEAVHESYFLKNAFLKLCKY